MAVMGSSRRVAGCRGPVTAGAGVAGRRGGLRATRPAIVALLALGLLLLLAAPAMALGERGHEFAFPFGEPGKGEGQLRKPAGLAVNYATGTVYVADNGNNRVAVYEPTFAGDGRVDGEKAAGELEGPDGHPESVAVDNSCWLNGLRGEGATETKRKEEETECAAKYPSNGDIYVTVGGEKGSIVKFSPNKTKIARYAKFVLKGAKKSEGEEFEEIDGVAVDSQGNVFVYRHEEAIDELNGAAANEGVAVIPSYEGKPGFAVDGEDNFYTGVGEYLGGSETASEEREEELVDQYEEEGEAAGLFEENDIAARLEKGTGKLLAPFLEPEYTTALAVNPVSEAGNEVSEAGDVYLVNPASLGTEQYETTVAQFSPPTEGHPGGTLLQRFGATGLKLGDGVAVDAKDGTVFVSDAVADKVDAFRLEGEVAPKASGLSAVVAGTTTLHANVDPVGAEAKYHFEYGPGRCTQVPSPCKSTSEASLAKAFHDEAATSEPLALPTGDYYFRIVAKNAYGTTVSAEQPFDVRAAVGGLPDGREWELVSPADKDGSQPEPNEAGGGLIQAAENGNAITYVGDGPMKTEGEVEGEREPEKTQLLSTRSSTGWGTRDIVTPNTYGSGISILPPEYQAFSASLALALVEPFPGASTSGAIASPPLSPALEGETEQEKTMYLRADAPEAPLAPGPSEKANYEQAKANGEALHNPGYLALVTKHNAPGGQPFGGGGGAKQGWGDFGDGGVEFLSGGTTPDLSHVVLASNRAEPGMYEWGPGETLTPVSKLENGTLVTPYEAKLGGPEGDVARHAVSNDGSRVFWTVETGHHPAALYLRDTGTGQSLRLDKQQEGVTGGTAEPIFQGANTAGTRVFFTDTQRLTANSRAGTYVGGEVKSPDLYVAELSAGSGPVSLVRLTDLTPAGIHGEGADVQGWVLGTGEEGEYVYAVANGALVAGASRGDCTGSSEVEEQPGTTCNLYVFHNAGSGWSTKLIGALSGADRPDWVAGIAHEGFLSYQTAGVSPKGQYLAFMSDQSLTDYDNEDVTSQAAGERLDEEVFEYDAAEGRLVCASCNPSGARPEGVDDAEASFEGGSLLVDRLEIWVGEKNGVTPERDDHWLAGNIPGYEKLFAGVASHQPRYIDESGRMFFDSPDHLVPASTTDKEKVYEYEPNTVGSCSDAGGCVALISSGDAERESTFLDASVNGNDVFFLTASRLVQQDTDESEDVYDARVCGSECLPPPTSGQPQCATLEECKGTYTPSTPATMAPATSSASGQGNVASYTVINTGPPPPKPSPAPKITKAEELAKALKACQAKYKGSRHKAKRLSCEKTARKKYGPPAKKASKGKKSSVKGGSR